MPTVNEDVVELTFDDFYDPDIDAEHKGRLRKYVIENGNELVVECEDPHGWWTVSLKKGKLPDYIKDNSYTTFRDALKDINRWMRERKHKIVYSVAKEKPKKEA